MYSEQLTKNYQRSKAIGEIMVSHVHALLNSSSTIITEQPKGVTYTSQENRVTHNICEPSTFFSLPFINAQKGGVFPMI